MFEDVKQKVIELIEKPLRQEECEVVDLVLSKYKNKWMLRLFVFSIRGTTIDECAHISQIVGYIIDGTDLFESGYTLEVSSPGLDRPLKSPRDFKYRVGEKVAINFVDSKQGRIEAEILSATDTQILVRNSAGEFTIGLGDIDKATIVY